MPPCTRFIAREDPHSKCILCLGFSHAREAVYGTSNCKICDDFSLITLRSRLEDYECESSNFSRRASSTNAPPREIAASREGSDVELEEMESEQTGLAFSLPPSPDRARANSPVEFLPDFQFPLSHFLHEWERLPGVSLWVLRTIRTGYTLQFGKNPPVSMGFT